MPPQNVLPAKTHSLETATLWALVVTLGVAVFGFLPFISTPFALVKAVALAAGVLVTLALFILARLSRGNIILPPILLVGALWLPVLAYALSAAFSGVGFMNALWGTALEPDTLGFMLVAAVLGSLAALAVRRVEHYRTFLAALGYGFGALVILQALIILVGQVAPGFVDPSLALIGSQSDLATVLGMGVIGTLLALRFIDVPSKVRVTSIVLGAIALLEIAIAGVSLVWMLVALVSLGLFVESVMRRRSGGMDADIEDATVVGEITSGSETGTHSLVLPLVVLAVSLFFLIGGSLSSALASSLHINVLNVRPSWQSTLSTGHAVYASSPLFGSGPSTFGAEWLKHRDATLNSTVFWSVDFTSGIGFLPTSFVTTGIIGALAWLGLIGLFLFFGLRALVLRAPENPLVRFTSFVSFVATFYLLVIAIFSLPSIVVLALLFVSAGLFASTLRYAAGGKQWGVVFGRSPRLGFVIVFVLTLVLLGSVVAAYALAERSLALSALSRANAALSVGNLPAADQGAQRAIAFAPTQMAYQLQAVVANAQLNTIVASTTLPAAQAQQEFQAALSSGINAALTATRLAPNNYQGWVALGNLYAEAVPLNVSGSYDSAKQAYEKAMALNPTNPQIPFIMAQLEVANKNNAAAITDLQKAISLKQDYTAAIFMLSQLEVQAGNIKDALSSALAAAYFTPNDPNVLFQVGVLSAASNDLPRAVQALSAAVAANPQFANARYFLAAVYAKQNDFANAQTQLEAIGALSTDNNTAVAPLIASLKTGKDPFPANILSASSTPVQQ